MAYKKHSKRNTKRQYKKLAKKLTKKQARGKVHSGGAIYTFDLNDKIGGQAARIPLNGTQDGDCPASDTADLGFVNYGMTRGGARIANRKYNKASKSRKSRKSSKKH